MANIKYEGNSKDAQDIVECAGMVLSTIRGTMPYVRDMGMDEIISRNIPDVEGEYFNQATEQIETWEERAAVKEISNLDSYAGEQAEPEVTLEDGE